MIPEAYVGSGKGSYQQVSSMEMVGAGCSLAWLSLIFTVKIGHGGFVVAQTGQEGRLREGEGGCRPRLQAACRPHRRPGPALPSAGGSGGISAWKSATRHGVTNKVLRSYCSLFSCETDALRHITIQRSTHEPLNTPKDARKEVVLNPPSQFNST